jgi:hypothetical protein
LTLPSIVDEPSEDFVPSKRLKGKQYRSANTAPKPTQDEKLKASISQDQSSPSGDTPNPNLLVEVIVPLRPAKNQAKSSPIEVNSSADDDENGLKRRPRRSGKAVKIVISDAEDADSGSEYDQEEDKKPSVIGKQAVDTEDEEMSADEEEEEEESEEEKPTRKAKAKSKPKPKAKAGVKKSKDTDEDDMEVDEAPSKVKVQRGKKRKSDAIASGNEDEDEKKPKKPKKEAKPKVSRASGDPWKLKTSAVKKDWTEMQAPPLEMFHFHRLVIDEYTYLDGKTHSLITNLQATCRWVLSGTPPVHDFPSLKTIAVFLGIHLGIDDDGEGQSAQVKKRRREQTGG